MSSVTDAILTKKNLPSIIDDTAFLTSALTILRCLMDNIEHTLSYTFVYEVEICISHVYHTHYLCASIRDEKSTRENV